MPRRPGRGGHAERGERSRGGKPAKTGHIRCRKIKGTRDGAIEQKIDLHPEVAGLRIHVVAQGHDGRAEREGDLSLAAGIVDEGLEIGRAVHISLRALGNVRRIQRKGSQHARSTRDVITRSRKCSGTERVRNRGNTTTRRGRPRGAIGIVDNRRL